MSGPRWAGTSDRAARYAARFAALAAGGVDVHGEATLCAELVDPGSRVLDAGCGTGRVAIRLAGLGYDCVGVDSDPHMLARARDASTAVRWRLRDLAVLDGGELDEAELDDPGELDESGDLDEGKLDDSANLGGPFDLVVAAGNVIPLVAPGTEAAVVANLARALKPAALLVAGFGLDAAHLPLQPAPFGLVEYDAWCAAAGLTLVERFAAWDRTAYTGGDTRSASTATTTPRELSRSIAA